MTTRKHAAGYLMNSSHTNPDDQHPQELRRRAAMWNPAMFTDPKYDAKMDEVVATATRPSARRCCAR